MDTASLLDPRFLLLDLPADPPGPALVAARQAFREAMTDFLHIPDSDLPWLFRWRADGKTNVRSAYYLAIEVLQEAAGRVAAGTADAGLDPGPVSGALAAVTRARWDLQALLLTIAESDLDADPGGGEWTVRQTVAHALSAQRAYPWFTAWWMSRRDAPDYPSSADDAHGEGLPIEEDEGSGSKAGIAARLDSLVDLASATWRDATAADLAVRCRWSGFPVDAGFRLGRWAPHLIEHTLQVDKTLIMLGRPTTEVARLVRLLHRAFGDLEAVMFALPSSSLDRADVGEHLVEASREVASLAVRAAAAAAEAA